MFRSSLDAKRHHRFMQYCIPPQSYHRVSAHECISLLKAFDNPSGGSFNSYGQQRGPGIVEWVKTSGSRLAGISNRYKRMAYDCLFYHAWCYRCSRSVWRAKDNLHMDTFDEREDCSAVVINYVFDSNRALSDMPVIGSVFTANDVY